MSHKSTRSEMRGLVEWKAPHYLGSKGIADAWWAGVRRAIPQRAAGYDLAQCRTDLEGPHGRGGRAVECEAVDSTDRISRKSETMVGGTAVGADAAGVVRHRSNGYRSGGARGDLQSGRAATDEVDSNNEFPSPPDDPHESPGGRLGRVVRRRRATALQLARR